MIVLTFDAPGASVPLACDAGSVNTGVLTAACAEQNDAMLDELVRAAGFDRTGGGNAFAVPVERVVGVTHFMTRKRDDDWRAARIRAPLCAWTRERPPILGR
jgi:hypothetical protein